MRTVFVWMLAALVFGSGCIVRASVPTGVGPGVVADALEHFNLPAEFQALIGDRALIDSYQNSHYGLETSQRPAPDPFMTVRHRNPLYLRTIVPQYASDVLDYWQGLPDSFAPLRSFRAPILTRASDLMDAVFPPRGLTNEAAAAAELIVRRLAHDGLLATLADVIQSLGPETFLANPTEGIGLLRKVGFPTGLLRCFQVERNNSDPLTTVLWIATRLRAGTDAGDLKRRLTAAPFQFVPSAPGFRIATESGEAELGLLRMQVDGGYRDGIIPGGSIDVIGQVVAALPNADSIISLPREHLEPFEHMARNWRLRRTNHVTLIGQPLPAGAWAQDNGKAGLIMDGAGGSQLATITPRFASIGEGKSNFKKAESLSMESLRAAGHRVVHSPLLFQGGNLLAVRDPKTGERILLVSEGDIHRNIALGLTADQIQEAFRVEFAVDRCVVMPAASYHLDFDVTVRATTNAVVAFVNDTRVAAREIVKIGISALERGGALSAATAGELRANFERGHDETVVRQISEVVRKARGSSKVLPDALVKCFTLDKIDSSVGNLQTFLLALDVIESALPSAKAAQERQAYLQALRQMHQRNTAQIERLCSLGWTVVTVPSMTDLFRSINYLNGIQHKDGYVMPIFGGLYGGMDRLAAAAFQSILGPDARIQQIRSADCQRHHGGVHCTVVAYPKL